MTPRFLGITPRSRLPLPVIVTLVLEFVGLGTLLLATRVAAERLGPVGFGEFSIARRTAPVLATAAMLGIGVALPRVIAETQGPRPHRQRAYLLAAFAIVGLGTVSLGAIMPLLVRTSILGEMDDELTAAVIVLALGSAVHGVAYAFERGRLALWRANLVVGVPLFIPLVVLPISPKSAPAVIALIGVGVGMIGAGSAADHLRGHTSLVEMRHAVRVLLRVGGPRALGDVALFVLFAMPAWDVGRRVGLVESGLITVPMMILQAGAAGFAAAGAYLLPWVRRALTEQRLHEVRGTVDRLALASCLVGLLGALAALACFQALASLLVGDLGTEAMPARLLILGLPGWLVYIILRNPIDAISQAPLNTGYLIAAVLVFAVLLDTGPASLTAAAVSAAIVLNGVGVAAWLSWWILARRHE